MIRLERVTAMFADLEEGELTVWIEQRWVQPEPGDGTWLFDEVDLARVRLIHDLRRALDIPEASLPVVLSLLDQVYELRCALRTVGDVLDREAPEVREAVAAALRRRGGAGDA